LYRKYDAWLIVPLHDSYIFESPLDVYTEVAQLTERVMCEVVQEHFPELDPKVEINTIDPSCWNKAGHSQSLECFLEDPTFSLDGVGPRKRTCSDSDEGPSDINRASRSHLKILDSSV
jgi:hypothetical protein